MELTQASFSVNFLACVGINTKSILMDIKNLTEFEFGKCLFKIKMELTGSVISAWGFDILCPSEATSFVPSYSFKFHLSFNTFNSFVFSFFSTIHGVSVS